MHRFIPELARRSAPRYTSYPTAAEFTGDVGSDAQRAAIEAVPPGEATSLYVHIPYCRSICWYCGCNTSAAGRGDRLGGYVDALLGEASLVANRFAGRVTAVHFGGGSPNALSPDDFARLADGLGERFGIAAEATWAAEIDPRGFTADYARILAAVGVGRVSLGVQTFAPHIQARINRIQPLAMIADTVTALRSAGIAQINFDLMYGLPGQTLDDIAATLARTIAFAPDRVAMFGYAHLPAMIPRQRMIDAAALPGARARFWQSALAHDMLVEAGYAAIGFDHFARPEDSLARTATQGALRRNFQGFTDDPAEVTIGLGASAISHFAALIVQNDKHVGAYRLRVGNGALAGVRGVRLDEDDVRRAEMIERLLCDGALDCGGEVAFTPETLSAIDRLAKYGIVTRCGNRVTLSEIGRPYARLVAMAFDARRNSSNAPIALAV